MNHTDFTFQRLNTNHKYDNHITCIIQQHYFTYQRTSNQELEVQLLNNMIADLQHQIHDITQGGGSDPK